MEKKLKVIQDVNICLKNETFWVIFKQLRYDVNFSDVVLSLMLYHESCICYDCVKVVHALRLFCYRNVGQLMFFISPQ